MFYNFYQDLGWLSGPLIGGVLTEYLDFARASSLIGIVIIVYSMIYMYFFKIEVSKSAAIKIELQAKGLES